MEYILEDVRGCAGKRKYVMGFKDDQEHGEHLEEAFTRAKDGQYDLDHRTGRLQCPGCDELHAWKDCEAFAGKKPDGHADATIRGRGGPTLRIPVDVVRRMREKELMEKDATAL